MNKTINKNRFKTLAKTFVNAGIDIEFQIDWGNTNSDGSLALSDRPRIGSGTYSGIEGWYFRRDNRNNYTPKQKKLIKEILLKKGFKCKGVSDYEVEYDNDRSYNPHISFILNDK